MKQTIKYLAMLMVLLSFGLTSASCSDDDDDVKDPETPTLIGSWKDTSQSNPVIWTFNADGTFETLEYISGTPYSEFGQYTYDESTGEVEVNFNGDYSWYFKVLSITSDELVITDGKVEGQTRTLTRVK
ncbi:MAG: lipocalin family protein [Candidatus Limisoma sp.]